MKFKYRGKKFDIDVQECAGVFSKFRGLMFRKKSKPLFFVFKKPTKQSIHSFFCKPFVAIWFNNERIIDVKFVKPWRFFVKPKEKFNKILEILSSDKNFKEILDGK